jgi:hypothetical protein
MQSAGNLTKAAASKQRRLLFYGQPLKPYNLSWAAVYKIKRLWTAAAEAPSLCPDDLIQRNSLQQPPARKQDKKIQSSSRSVPQKKPLQASSQRQHPY